MVWIGIKRCMVVRKINCFISVLLIVLSGFLGLIAVIFAYIDNLFSVPIIYIAIALILLLLSVQFFRATKYKKPVFLIINISVLLVFGVVFLASIPIRRENDKKLWEERNKIVSQIESGELNPESGIVYLDESSVNEQISDSCRVILAMDGENPGIYFFEYAGMLESSSGYIYYSDLIKANDCLQGMRFINKEKIEGNWYRCSTD